MKEGSDERKGRNKGQKGRCGIWVEENEGIRKNKKERKEMKGRKEENKETKGNKIKYRTSIK